MKRKLIIVQILSQSLVYYYKLLIFFPAATNIPGENCFHFLTLNLVFCTYFALLLPLCIILKPVYVGYTMYELAS